MYIEESYRKVYRSHSMIGIEIELYNTDNDVIRESEGARIN